MEKKMYTREEFMKDIACLRRGGEDLTKMTIQHWLTDEDIFGLCHAMERHSRLKALFIQVNNINGARAMALVRSNCMLTELDLRSNDVGDDGAIALAQNTMLTTLNLSQNNIRERACVALARNTTLTTLDLSYNNIGDVGAAALSRNTTLTTLKLFSNNIGDVGAVELARNSTLRTLKLGTNKVGDCGVVALALNTRLMDLDLCRNPIGNNGVIALARNTTLTRISLSHVHVGERAVAALAQNTTLTNLMVWSVFYSPLWQQVLKHIDRNRETTRALLEACKTATSSYEAVVSLLETGVRPYGSYIQNRLGYRDTLLHLAVRRRQPALVDLLLSHGADADCNTKNDDNVTYRELAKTMCVPLSSAYFGSMPPYYQ